MSQFFSVVKKNALEKRRNIRVTCCECFSHLAIFVLLMAGIQLSTIVKTFSQNYVKLDIYVPPTFISDRKLNSPVSSTTASNTSTKTNGSNTSQGPTFNLPFDINIAKLFTGLQLQLKGPVIIPPFDAYIAVAQSITNIVKNVNQNSLNTVQQTSFGRAFGNIVNLGTLHFCPFPSDEVKSLINYLNTTTTTFRSLNVRTHTTEIAAVRYILANLNERAFALIVIHQITPTKINYEIRQNYSTLPNSNRIVNSVTTGLDTTYQGYLLSGFLTLEDTIDRWAVDYAIKKVNPIAESCILPTPFLVPMPTYEFNGNPFYASVGSILGLALTMSTIYPVSRLIKNVVEEKETVWLIARCTSD